LTAQAPAPPATVDVLVCGGGPVGLTAAALLGTFGVRVLLVERHPATSIHPKARGISARSLEVFDQLGLADEIIGYAAAIGGVNPQVRVSRTLADPADVVMPVGDPQRWLQYSRFRSALCPQTHLEQLLRGRAAAEPTVVLRFATRLERFDESHDGVEALLVDDQGGEAVVQASYLVAADGHRSGVREALGIAWEGTADLEHHRNILFRADLRRLVADHPCVGYAVRSPLPGSFMPVDNASTWMYDYRIPAPDALRPPEFGDDETLLRTAIGGPASPEVISAVTWSPAGQVAGSFATNRVFLVGDAAHVMPPTGAMGANTGIQDAHGLAWKLAAVLRGLAQTDLLASHHAERHPVAVATVARAMGNLADAAAPRPAGQPPRMLAEPPGLLMGYAYDSSVIIDDGANAPPWRDEPDRYEPSGRPGGRVPDVGLVVGGRASSVHQQLRTELLFITESSAPWSTVADRVNRTLGGNAARVLLLGGHAVMTGERAPCADPFGIGADGAVLVRPDGIVAARWSSAADTADAVQLVRQALGWS
jgi:putative polyketide hydroxylase